MHQNYVGYIEGTDKEAFVLSVVLSDANNLNVSQYRAILWKKIVRIRNVEINLCNLNILHFIIDKLSLVNTLGQSEDMSTIQSTETTFC